MIIAFHIIFDIFISLIQKYMKKGVGKDCSKLKDCDVEENLSFDPPVYKQRYGAVHNILLDNPWKDSVKKIVDFGCAELQLFSFVKWLHRINEILEVDIDYDLLKDHLYRIRPLTSDYLSRRLEPLTVHVLQGNISDPDERLLGTDVVVGIELIEHLYPDDLDALPYNVFSFIKPKIAIFTTPNADFNILFPNFKGFRHPDHKFEWTRDQFELWATNITVRFPDYSVKFEGIGEGPSGTEHLGCCSQMAVFVKNLATESSKDKLETNSVGVCRYNCYSEMVYKTSGSDGNYYTLIDTIEYPYEKDDRTLEQKILHELQYEMQLRSNTNGRFYNQTAHRVEIPVTEIIYNYKGTIATESEAREILENANYQIEECTIFNELEICVVFEPEMEDSQSSSPLTSPDSKLDDLDSDWNPFPSDDDPWETNSDYLKARITDTPTGESSEVAWEVVDGLVNNMNLPEVKSKISNGINVSIANDMQKLIPLHEHERKVRLTLKSQTLTGLSEAGPSYAKKRRKKIHEDDNESLQDVFKNAEIESKSKEENAVIVEVNDSDGEDLQNVVQSDAEDISEAVDLEMEVASREALFDPNSVIELSDLEEFVNESNNDVEGSDHLVLIGINLDPDENETDGPVLPLNADPFPNWLLHMLGADVVGEEITHDEPHFYCQGDGVGVHPSFIEGEFEEDHSSSGSDSSSNESNDSATVSNDAAEAEPTVSEGEVVSLPEDSVHEAVVNPAVPSPQTVLPSSSAETSETFYDTVDESSVSMSNPQKHESKSATTSNKE